MKSTLRYRKYCVIFIIFGMFLTSCNQSVDLYFYPDDSWQAKSNLTFSQIEKQTIELLDDGFANLVSEALETELPINLSVSNDAFSAVFDALIVYYADQGIDFSWRGGSGNFSFIATGQTLEQFERLLPGSISLKKVEEGRLHLNINLTEINSYAAIVYHQEITLHAGEIVSHNAPGSMGVSSVTWQNPREIDAVFSPITPSSWKIILWICGILLLALIPIVFYANRPRCPSCRKTVPKNVESCPYCEAWFDFNS